jgi:hypothetical protein
MWKVELGMRNLEFGMRVERCALQVAGYELRVARCVFRVAGYSASTVIVNKQLGWRMEYVR